MELRHIYDIADAINNGIKEKTIKDNILEDVVVTVNVSPVTHYGIDKEFYRQTHNNNINGFVRSEKIVTAIINGVTFRIINKGDNI